MMNIALIYPGNKRLGPVPLGIISLSAFLRQRGIDPRVINFDGVIDFDKELDRCFSNYAPDVVGITTYTSPSLERVVTIVHHIKRRFTGAKIVLGGVHASIFAEDIIKELPVDVVVIGEGEESLWELINAFSAGSDLSSVCGIVYKEGSVLVRTNMRLPIADINLLPRPDWEKIDISGQYYVYLIESRGCPFSCSFCYNALHKDYRTKSVDTVIKDFRYLYDTYRIGVIKFWDDLPFGGSKKLMIEFCDRLIREKIKIMWSSFARHEMINREVVDAMVRAGCFRIAIGVESGSPNMLNLLNKKTNPDVYKNAFNILGKFDIISVANFMIGLPGETEEDLSKSIRLARELMAVEYFAVNFKPYAGTELYKICLGRGFIPPKSTLEWSKITDFFDFKFNFSNVGSDTLKAASRTIMSMQNVPKLRKVMLRVAWHSFKLNPYLEINKIVRLMNNRLNIAVDNLLTRKQL